MGIIVLGEDGELHLEDDSLRVKLNFMFAHSDRRSYFTQGSIVIAEGEYRTETFFVDFVAQPPLKFKQRAKDIIVNDNFGAYTYAKNKIIKESDGQISSEAISISKSKQDIPNKINENEAIVVISSLSLDEPSSISSLDEIFKAYEQINWLSTFILWGEFISNKKVDTLDFDGIKFCFDELAALIKKYDRLKNECRFVLIPGVNDAANDQILPLSPLCDYFTSSFSGIKNVTFAWNPWRINFYGKQIVIWRYNYLKKIKKNSIYLGGDINNEPQENMEESKEIIEPNQSDEIDGKKYLNLNIIESIKIANTVLLQANLIPLPYLIQPVYWDYAECLNLNTIPDYLILADTWAQYTVDNKEDFETFVVNPGNFSCSKTFSIIYPHLGKVEESSLSNNME